MKHTEWSLTSNVCRTGHKFLIFGPGPDGFSAAIADVRGWDGAEYRARFIIKACNREARVALDAAVNVYGQVSDTYSKGALSRVNEVLKRAEGE